MTCIKPWEQLGGIFCVCDESLTLHIQVFLSPLLSRQRGHMWLPKMGTKYTQYPRMMPRLKPQSFNISDTTARSRLSEAAPYWPCIRTLNISTVGQEWVSWTLGMLTRRTWTSENGICRSSHRARCCYLFQWEVGKWGYDTFWNPIRSKEQRIHTRYT